MNIDTFLVYLFQNYSSLNAIMLYYSSIFKHMGYSCPTLFRGVSSIIRSCPIPSSTTFIEDIRLSHTVNYTRIEQSFKLCLLQKNLGLRNAHRTSPLRTAWVTLTGAQEVTPVNVHGADPSSVGSGISPTFLLGELVTLP